MLFWLIIAGVLLAFIIWGSTRKTRLGHWLRVVVMFLSGGFVFPHALTEDDDLAENPGEKDAKAKKA